MAELLGVGLVAFEIVQRGLQDLARLLVGADDVDRMPDGGHRLLEDEDLVLLAEVANEHQYFLAGHGSSPPEIKRLPAALMKERDGKCNRKRPAVQI